MQRYQQFTGQRSQELQITGSAVSRIWNFYDNCCIMEIYCFCASMMKFKIRIMNWCRKTGKKPEREKNSVLVRLDEWIWNRFNRVCCFRVLFEWARSCFGSKSFRFNLRVVWFWNCFRRCSISNTMEKKRSKTKQSPNQSSFIEKSTSLSCFYTVVFRFAWQRTYIKIQIQIRKQIQI